MLKKSLFTYLLIAVIAACSLSAAAQSPKGFFPVKKSTLAAIDLPPGALQIKDYYVPEYIKKMLAELIEAGGPAIRQGNSEVIVWTRSRLKNSKPEQTFKKIETSLQSADWTYEIIHQEDDYIVFSLMRDEPELRGIFGFFSLSDNSMVFAMTELQKADKPATELAVKK